MKQRLRWLFPSSNFDAVPAAIAGFLIIFAFTRHSGIGVSPDSVVYMSTAANIVHHGVMNDYQNVPIADFPCFYPLFLAGILFVTRIAVMDFAPVLNGLLFAGLIYGCGWIMERFAIRSKVYKWILLLILVSSPCLLEVYSMLWSETLFIVWTIILLPVLHHYLRSHSMRALAALSLVCALAFVTRYAGITLIGTAGFFILLDRGLKPVKKGVHLVVFGGISISLVALNLVRNSLINGTLTGYREKGITPFRQNLHDMGIVFCDWLPFFNGRYRGGGAVAALFFVLLVVLFVRRLIGKAGARTSGEGMRKVLGFQSYENIATAYFIVYFLFMLLTATLSRFQTLNSRLLSPLFIPWVWGASCWLPSLLRSLKADSLGAGADGAGMGGAAGGGVRAAGKAKKKWMAVLAVMLIAAGCFLWGQKQADWETWDGVKDAGIPGYTEDPWRDSETIHYIRENKAFFEKFSIRYTLYSNANDAIWFLLGGLHADMIPHKDFKNDIAEFLNEKTFYIFWFNDASNNDQIKLPFIGSHLRLVEEHRFADGAVFKYDGVLSDAPTNAGATPMGGAAPVDSTKRAKDPAVHPTGGEPVR